MVCFTKLTPRTPPSVIHGWKATDLLYEMEERKNYLLNPVSRQNFADALAENHNLKLEVCLMLNKNYDYYLDLDPDNLQRKPLKADQG